MARVDLKNVRYLVVLEDASVLLWDKKRLPGDVIMYADSHMGAKKVVAVIPLVNVEEAVFTLFSDIELRAKVEAILHEVIKSKGERRG